MKILLVLVLLVAATAVQAANPRLNCTASCTATTDAYPASGPQPASCKLYANNVLKAQVAPIQVVAGSFKCEWVVTFAVGTYTLTSTAVDSAGLETAPSNPFVFDSAVPLLPPANLRVL
jgi:hypothetical protein